MERIKLQVAPAADAMCNIAEPRTGLELKFSLKGVCAMTLAGFDTANPVSYDDAAANDPQLRALASKVDVDLDPALKLGDTIVHLHEGAVRSATASTDDFDRDPERLRQRLQAKFASLTLPLIGKEACERIATEVLETPLGPSVPRLNDLVHRCVWPQ